MLETCVVDCREKEKIRVLNPPVEPRKERKKCSNYKKQVFLLYIVSHNSLFLSFLHQYRCFRLQSLLSSSPINMIAKCCGIFIILNLFLNSSLANKNIKNNNNNGRGECGIAKQDATVPGNLYQGQWPFTAAIYHLLNDQLTFLCGGTIISKIFIITGKIFVESTRKMIINVCDFEILFYPFSSRSLFYRQIGNYTKIWKRFASPCWRL